VRPTTPREAPHKATTAPTIANPALFALTSESTRSTRTCRTLSGSASLAIPTPCITVASGSTKNDSDPTKITIGNSAITA